MQPRLIASCLVLQYAACPVLFKVALYSIFVQICIQDSGCLVHKRTKIFGSINRLNSLRARAASVKHKYCAKNTIKCYLKINLQAI